METVLLVAAEKIEFDGVTGRLEHMRPLAWGLDCALEGVLRNRRVVAVANGPGPKLAAEAVRTACGQTKIDRIVSTGFCGALDASLAIGDIVRDAGRIASVDRVAVTPGDKQALRRSGADVVEMEYAGVRDEAKRRGLPCSAVRVVSDTANEELPFDFNRYRRSDGRFDRTGIAFAAIVRPWKIPALLRLQRNCKSASAKLGEFFATCDF